MSPTRFLSIKRRETILLILDALGKWSLLDTYLLIMMMVGFRLSVYSSEYPGVMLTVLVTPDWGCYLFMCATMLSLAMSHVIIGGHRYTSPAPHYNDEKKSLAKRAFFESTYALQILGPLLILLLLFASIVLIIYSAFQECIEFSVGGAVGTVMEFVNETNTFSYSLYSFGAEFPSGTSAPDSFGVRFIQTFYFLFALIVPVVHCILLFILWVLPFSLSRQRHFFFVIEICHAWSTMDVLTLALITAFWEVSAFVQYLLEGTHRCDTINMILEKYFDADLHGDDKCIDMQLSFTDNVWSLFTACFLYIIAVHLAMRIMRKALHKSPLEIVVPVVQ